MTVQKSSKQFERKISKNFLLKKNAHKKKTFKKKRKIQQTIKITIQKSLKTYKKRTKIKNK